MSKHLMHLTESRNRCKPMLLEWRRWSWS